MSELISLNLICYHTRRYQCGIWTDYLYRCFPILKCRKCGEEFYVSTPAGAQRGGVKHRFSR